jgi:hypothetical protein
MHAEGAFSIQVSLQVLGDSHELTGAERVVPGPGISGPFCLDAFRDRRVSRHAEKGSLHAR